MAPWREKPCSHCPGWIPELKWKQCGTGQSIWCVFPGVLGWNPARSHLFQSLKPEYEGVNQAAPTSNFILDSYFLHVSWLIAGSESLGTAQLPEASLSLPEHFTLTQVESTACWSAWQWTGLRRRSSLRTNHQSCTAVRLCFVVRFCLLMQSLILSPWLALNSNSQRYSCFCLLNAGFKGMVAHAQHILRIWILPPEAGQTAQRLRGLAALTEHSSLVPSS